MIAGGSLTALVNVFAVLQPEILRRAIDDMKGGVPSHTMAVYAGLLIALVAVEGTLRYLMRTILIGVSRKVEYDLRNHLFERLTRLSAGFYRGHRVGDLMARATNDLEAVRSVIGPGLMYGANTLSLAPVVIALMCRRDPMLTLLALAPFPLLAFGFHRLGRAVHRRYRDVQDGYAQLSTQVQENLAGIRVVKAAAVAQHEAEEFHRANDDYRRRNLRMILLRAAYEPMMTLTAALSYIAVLGWGGTRVARGELTLGDLVAFLAYLGMLLWPMMAIGWVSGLFQRGIAALERIAALLDARPDIADPPVPRSRPAPRGEVTFDRVTFSYNGEPVLREVSFSVPAGETTAVVGRTGAGKTTLLLLLARIQDPGGGRVLLDGVDVRELALADLRSALALVPQETFLFSLSLRENILFGARDRAEGDGAPPPFDRAAEVSRITRDVDQFPHGFDTLVGERGVTLSGGERQRAALARALVREPQVILLDDPFASVDPRTEEEILQGLRKLRPRPTILLVSHRLASLRDARQIVVLEDGRVAERGTYEELLARDGAFGELHRRQQLLLELERE